MGSHPKGIGCPSSCYSQGPETLGPALSQQTRPLNPIGWPMSVCQYIIEKIQSDLLSVLRRPSISFRYYMVRQSTRFHSVDGLFHREKRLSRLNYHHLLGECALPSLPQRYCPVVLFSCWAEKKRKEKLLQRFRAGSNKKEEVGSILVLSFVLTAKRRTPGQQLGVGPFNGLVRGRITRTNYVDV